MIVCRHRPPAPGVPLRSGTVTAQARQFVPALAAVGRAEHGRVLDAGVRGIRIGQRRLDVPDALELPRVRCAVVPLVRARDAVIRELVVHGGPRLAAVVRALNELAEPAARLGGVDPVRVDRRALQVIELPSAKEWPCNIPVLPRSICVDDESTLARSDEHSVPELMPLLSAWEKPHGSPTQLVDPDDRNSTGTKDGSDSLVRVRTRHLNRASAPQGRWRAATPGTHSYNQEVKTTATATAPATSSTAVAHQEMTAFAVLAAISVAHLLNDTIQSLLPAIYPLLKTSFNLSFAQIGMMTLALMLTASVLQPVVGHYTDTRPTPHALLVGMAFSLAGLLLLAVAHTYLDAARRGRTGWARVVRVPSRVVAHRANGIRRTAWARAVAVPGRRKRRVVGRTAGGRVHRRAVRAAGARLVLGDCDCWNGGGVACWTLVPASHAGSRGLAARPPDDRGPLPFLARASAGRSQCLPPSSSASTSTSRA